MKALSKLKETLGFKKKSTDGTDTVPLLPADMEYVNRLCSFNKYYTRLFVSVAAVMMLAIAVAVLKSWLIGTCIAIICGMLYSFFAEDELLRRLGLKYRGIIGNLCITACRAKYGNEFFVPSRLMWYDITELDDNAFVSPKNAELACVHLPKTLNKIGVNVFDDCPMLEKICFEGSKEDWEKIVSGTSFDAFTIEFNVEYPKRKDKSQ